LIHQGLFEAGEIMEVKTFKIGDRVDQMCITCNEERGHIVVSVSKTGKITRVGCPMCASRVTYRAGTTRRASSKDGAPYDRLRTYRKGQTLIHATFGEGEVTAIVEPQKMDVLFADRIRRLIHAQS
jgi:DNA-directed RNA polymerase subunit RPC12/RpoP